MATSMMATKGQLGKRARRTTNVKGRIEATRGRRAAVHVRSERKKENTSGKRKKNEKCKAAVVEESTMAMSGAKPLHPLTPLSKEELEAAVGAVKAALGEDNLRFNHVSLQEPTKASLVEYLESKCDETKLPKREASVRVMRVVGDGADGSETVDAVVDMSAGAVTKTHVYPAGTNALLTPDDCSLAEDIVRGDASVLGALRDRFGFTDVDKLICDPWSVHMASDSHPALEAAGSAHPRLVQTFLYARNGSDDDNQYAHPIDILPTVDLNSGKVVHIFIPEGDAPEGIPMQSVNYHRDMIETNDFLETCFRADPPKPLDVVQPDGPSFRVDGNDVEWQKWKLTVGFNHREGLVLHDVSYDGRPVLFRGSLVEMAVPYGDPNPPFEGKCAFDVGDYGLGYCTNSLKLGCDCLGSIHYFDSGAMCRSDGSAYTVPQAICLHEEDVGLLWKHVEFRNGHSEARRSRRLVLSSIVTVVNYEVRIHLSQLCVCVCVCVCMCIVFAFVFMMRLSSSST